MDDTLLGPVRICIPSKHRTTNVPRMRQLFSTAWWFVDEVEADDYLGAGVPESQLKTHTSLRGLGRIRNWMMDHAESDALAMMDDDIIGLTSLVGRRARRYSSPEVAATVIRNLYQVGTDLGLHACGWGASPDIAFFSGYAPFGLKSDFNGAYMICRQGIRFDDDILTMEDFDFVLKVLLTDRIALVEKRWCWVRTPVTGTRGGLQSTRSQEVRAADLVRLKASWGDYFRAPTTMEHETNVFNVVRRCKLAAD
jgi:hypothetical protein